LKQSNKYNKIFSKPFVNASGFLFLTQENFIEEFFVTVTSSLWHHRLRRTLQLFLFMASWCPIIFLSLMTFANPVADFFVSVF